MNQIERIDEKAQLQLQRERAHSGFADFVQEEQTTPVREGLKMIQESAQHQFFKQDQEIKRWQSTLMGLQTKYQKKTHQLQQMILESKGFDRSKPPVYKKNTQLQTQPKSRSPAKDINHVKSLLQKAEQLQSKMRIQLGDLKDSKLAKQRQDHYSEQLMQLSAAQQPGGQYDVQE